jgi:hypothetical protein
MEKNLSACLDKLGLGQNHSMFMNSGITSLDVLKALYDNEILHVFEIKYTHVRLIQNLAYYLRHLDRVQRAFDLDNVTIEKMEEMKLMKDFEEGQKQKAIPMFPSTFNQPSLPTSRGGLTRYLEQFLGSSGVPLTYVVREQELPSAEEETSMTKWLPVLH